MADDRAVEAPPRPAERPCGTCPYRVGVPAGIWHPDEYAKLPGYDGETFAQTRTALFLCHKKTGALCAGWVACHDTDHLLALRLHAVDASVFTYVSPVPVFGSGREACEHGLSGIVAPSTDARCAASCADARASRRRRLPDRGKPGSAGQDVVVDRDVAEGVLVGGDELIAGRARRARAAAVAMHRRHRRRRAGGVIIAAVVIHIHVGER